MPWGLIFNCNVNKTTSSTEKMATLADRKIPFKLFISTVVVTIILLLILVSVIIALAGNEKPEESNLSTSTEKLVINTTTTEEFKEYQDQENTVILGCPFEVGWIGDGSCDDHTNTELCSYDGGDCCLEPVIKDDYCIDCICHLDGTRHPSKNTESTTTLLPSTTLEFTTISTSIANTTASMSFYPNCEPGYLEWIGDGSCDDSTNIEDCNFDGGDCCLEFVVKDFCYECCCHQDECASKTSTTTEANLFCPTCIHSHGMYLYLGDTVCDNFLNTEECCYDYGDCYQPYLITVTPVNPDSTNEPPECDPESFIGDTFCDDYLNIPICDFDGGDCCSDSIGEFCSLCTCFVPANYTGALSDKCQSSWIGDGQCDDANNNLGCQYDGDDCCGDKGENQFAYCNVCQCYS